MKKILLGTLLLLTTLVAPAYEIVDLYYRDAAEVARIIQGSIRSGEAVTSIDNKIIIDASSTRTQEITQLIRQLDKKTTVFLIEVEQSASGQGRSSGVDANADVRINNGNTKVRGRVGIGADRNNYSSNNVQTLRVSAGSEGYIELGKDRQYYDGVYRTVSTGMRVVPRMLGTNGVKLELYTENHGQRAATTVQGQLGQWISVGGIGTEGQSSSQGIISYSRGNQSSNSNIRLRVTVAQ